MAFLPKASYINHGGISLPSGARLFLGLPSSLGLDTTLQGGGDVALNNATIDLCSTATLSKPLTLNNVDNIISGYGAIGSNATGASLVLNNGQAGVINANTNAQVLVIHSNVINSHLLEATGGGTLALFGFAVVANATGTIKADTGSTVSVQDTIKGGRLEGAGVITQDGGAQLDGSTTPLTNTGTMKATGGDLYIASPLSNTGVLIADAVSLVVAQASTGGTAKLDQGGQIEFGGATTTAVRFDDNSASSLVLDNSVHFKGVITNFGKLNTDQSIDLLDIDPLTAAKTFTAGSPNVLTVKDAAGHTAQLKFSGSYTIANFKLTDDGHGGTLIKDPPAASPANVTLFGNYIAAGFPVPAATPCPALLAGHEALLSRWRSQDTAAEARWFLVDPEASLRGARRATKQSIILHQYGSLRRACDRAGHFGPDPLARNEVRAQLEPLVGSEVPHRPANPFLTRTRGLCGDYPHARKFDVRRGTGIGTAALGGVAPAEHGGPHAAHANSPVGCGSRHRFAPRRVQRERTRREPRSPCAACARSGRDTLQLFWRLQAALRLLHPPRPVRARRR